MVVFFTTCIVQRKVYCARIGYELLFTNRNGRLLVCVDCYPILARGAVLVGKQVGKNTRLSLGELNDSASDMKGPESGVEPCLDGKSEI